MIAEVKASLELLEDDWNAMARDPVGKIQAGLTACAMIAGFFGALRGEEIVRVDAGSMMSHWDESVSYTEAPHIPLMLVGRFKREIGEKIFTQPLAIESNSGVTIMLWFFRTLDLLHRNGANNRWRKHSRARGSLPSMSMMERYTDAKANVKALIRFSGGL